jgi:hypothetical protein
MLKDKSQLTATEILANATTEKELKHNVEAAFRQLGWTYFHAFFSQYSPAGYPDETATRGDRTVWFELKTMKGTVKPKQIEWLDALSDNPHNEVFLIRPNQMQLVIDVLGQPDSYQGPERWTRSNHFGI